MDWHDHYEAALRHTRNAEDHFGIADGTEPDWLAACRCFGTAADHLQHVLFHIAQRAYSAGETKKAIALALGIPASTLRGLQK